MTAKRFLRQWSVIVGTTRIDGLRLTFDIEKNDKREPNKATITLTNLSPTTRARFEQKGLLLVVEAGYKGLVSAVFTGSTFRTTHKRDGADIVTTIEAADGGPEVSSAKGRWSYAPGTSIATVVRDVAAAVGLPLSTGSRITPKPVAFRNGWAFVGGAADALDAATKAGGLRWSVQDGQVQILAADVDDDGVTAVVLSASTGMIGSPERIEVKDPKSTTASAKKQRVQVKCEIDPSIRPTRLVDVRSVDFPALSGIYTVKSQKTVGDSHGADWSMTLELQKRL